MAEGTRKTRRIRRVVELTEPIKKTEEKIEPVIKAEEVPVPAKPLEVQLGNLNIATEFMIGNQKYRVADKEADMVVATKLGQVSGETGMMWTAVGQITLAAYTMVKPVK